MIEGLKRRFLPNRKRFREKDWHLDILLFPIEQEFLTSEFPKKLQIVEWVSRERSKIDRRYFDICWMTEEKKEGRPGLFIAFMKPDVFARAFEGVGKEPEEYCAMRVNIVVQKHDDANDPKSHPNWGCWLEVVAAEFVRWEPEQCQS